MNALPRHAPHGIREYQRIQHQADSRDALSIWAIDRLAKEIDADTSRVSELFMDEAIDLRAKGLGEGGLELIELSVLAMNAWPVFEKLICGQELTPDEAAAPPALFRALRPLIDRRAVLVREAAEDELTREGEEAAKEYVP